MARAHRPAPCTPRDGPGARWLRSPDDLNALLPELWAGTRPARRRRRRSPSAGSPSSTSPPSTAPPPSSWTRPTSAPGPAPSHRVRRRLRDICGGADVYYAGKSFLSTAVARWVAEEGLRLDTASGGELAVGRAPGSTRRTWRCTATTSPTPRSTGPWTRRSAGSWWTPPTSSSASRGIARARGVRAQVMLRLNLGVHAHTHEFIATAHEDQKFGLSMADGAAGRPSWPNVPAPAPSSSCSACTATSARRSSSRTASPSPPETARLARRRCSTSTPSCCPSWTSAAATASPTPPTDPPLPAAEIAAGWPPVARQVRRGRHRRAADLHRARPRHRRADHVHAVRGRHAEAVRLDAGGLRTYVRVDGGMSDNARPVLYDADYSAPSPRAPPTPRRCSPA